MKKYTILLLTAFLFTGCTLGPFALVPTSTPEPTLTNTSTPLPSLTPVLPTQTYTSTPTLIGLKTATPTPAFVDSTETPVLTITPLAQITPNTPTAAISLDGFVSVTTSLTEFYKAGECEPSTVRITAQAADITNTAFVLLFVRFKSMAAERTGKWTIIYMDTIGAGTYLHDLSTSEIREDAYFTTSWVEYQIVATTQSGKEIGRTDIFKERLTMLACVPTATPTSANVRP